MTRVIFRKFKKGADVIALFPRLPGDSNPHTCQSYQHVGQHGAASVYLVRDTVPASFEEYAPLFAELRSIGYSDLVAVKRMTRADRVARIKACG